MVEPARSCRLARCTSDSTLHPSVHLETAGTCLWAERYGKLEEDSVRDYGFESSVNHERVADHTSYFDARWVLVGHGPASCVAESEGVARKSCICEPSGEGAAASHSDDRRRMGTLVQDIGVSEGDHLTLQGLARGVGGSLRRLTMGVHGGAGHG